MTPNDNSTPNVDNNNGGGGTTPEAGGNGNGGETGPEAGGNVNWDEVEAWDGKSPVTITFTPGTKLSGTYQGRGQYSNIKFEITGDKAKFPSITEEKVVDGYYYDVNVPASIIKYQMELPNYPKDDPFTNLTVKQSYVAFSTETSIEPKVINCKEDLNNFREIKNGHIYTYFNKELFAEAKKIKSDYPKTATEAIFGDSSEPYFKGELTWTEGEELTLKFTPGTKVSGTFTYKNTGDNGVATYEVGNGKISRTYTKEGNPTNDHYEATYYDLPLEVQNVLIKNKEFITGAPCSFFIFESNKQLITNPVTINSLDEFNSFLQDNKVTPIPYYNNTALDTAKTQVKNIPEGAIEAIEIGQLAFKYN